MKQSKYDVFISYSRKDYVDANNNVIPGNVVSQVKDVLKQAGVSYWFDEEGIYSGDNFVEKIVNNIEEAQIFVFLSTENANKSPWTCKEIASAHSLEKYIIPVRIDKSKYNKKVLFYLADIDFIDYSANPEKGLECLIESIKNHLEEVEAEERRKQEEENRRKEEERRKAEELKRQKEEEARRFQEEQDKLIADIETSCRMLENDESKIKLERSNLLLKAKDIVDIERREALKEKIKRGGPIYQQYQKSVEESADEIDRLKKRIHQLEEALRSSEDRLKMSADSAAETMKLNGRIHQLEGRLRLSEDALKKKDAIITGLKSDLQKSKVSGIRSDVVIRIKSVLLAHKKLWIGGCIGFGIIFIGLAMFLFWLFLDGQGYAPDPASNPYDTIVVEDTVDTLGEYDYVDLGLSVNWGAYNLGASSPEEYGDYYAWAETKPRTGSSWNYDWDTTPYYKSGDSWENVKWTKYTGSDGKTVLDASDDAATVALGSPWRMPTLDEIKELRVKCKWTWTTMNGKNGYKVVGPNGNFIFLPAAGWRNGSSLAGAGTNGVYWSSSLNTDDPSNAYYLYFYSTNHDWYRNSRYGGRSVRPVRP